MKYPELVINNFTYEQKQGIHRVSALIGGELVWFESNAPLAVSPEAFACFMLSPSLEFNYQLKIDAAVDDAWYNNTQHISFILAKHFGFAEIMPQVMRINKNSEPIKQTDRTALCFSGGVDSFYSLLHYPQTIHELILVQGFDIPLDDTVRMHALESAAYSVAKQREMEVTIIRTNLRQHSILDRQQWEIAHHGALTALGHLLNSKIDQLVISSTVSKNQSSDLFGLPWKTTPFYSSNSLKVSLYGDTDRLQKIQFVAHDPLVQQHLRVCWINQVNKINCSTCSKCVCTRLGLATINALDYYNLLANTHSLAKDIAALPPIDPMKHNLHLQIVEQALTYETLEPHIRYEAEQLLARSR